MSTHDVLIIGAGPFGLSIASHLSNLGVERRVLGRPMDTWRTHMPNGMNLRSEPYGSDIAAPVSGYDLRTFSGDRDLDYVDRLGPLSLERFLDYAGWYVDSLVPDVEDLTVTDISARDGGFAIRTANEESFTARRVVVATGVLPYAYLPEELSGLPVGLVSHTGDHLDIEAFAGRRVAVVGGGQSALETAALLHEAGADVHVVARRGALNWLAPNPARISNVGHIRRPVNKLCEGWHCAFWNSPAAFRRLPLDLRVEKARTVLGPAGAWWLKDRVQGKVDVLTSHRLIAAAPSGSGVRLSLDGQRPSLDVEHVIAGTGFKIDISRLPFLSEQLLAGIRRHGGSPALRRSGESTVSGLFFAGAPAAVSLGPSVRFIAGTHNSARQVARALVPRGGPRSARRDGMSQQPESSLTTVGAGTDPRI